MNSHISKSQMIVYMSIIMCTATIVSLETIMASPLCQINKLQVNSLTSQEVISVMFDLTISLDGTRHKLMQINVTENEAKDIEKIYKEGSTHVCRIKGLISMTVTKIGNINVTDENSVKLDLLFAVSINIICLIAFSILTVMLYVRLNEEGKKRQRIKIN